MHSPFFVVTKVLLCHPNKLSNLFTYPSCHYECKCIRMCFRSIHWIAGLLVAAVGWKRYAVASEAWCCWVKGSHCQMGEATSNLPKHLAIFLDGFPIDFTCVSMSQLSSSQSRNCGGAGTARNLRTHHNYHSFIIVITWKIR